jgi:Zn-dependent oligopeptidase
MSLGLTQKEFDWMKRIEKEIDKVWTDLNPWEQRFMENRIEDFRKYGMKLRMSKAQWNVIDRISEKII